MNIDIARHNMLTQQCKACNIVDQNLLSLLQSTPRENFVSVQYEKLAFSDTQLPLNVPNEVMLTPLMEAKILDAVQIKPDDHVLEIGTGSAYLTCLIGKLARSLVSCDIYTAFLNEAQEKLLSHGVHDVDLIEQDAMISLPNKGPFDVIIYTGSVAEIPEKLPMALKENGRVFIVVGREPNMKAMLLKRVPGSHQLKKIILFETSLPPLRERQSQSFFEF